jgi:tetraacyldisaccharide 4'-kinase
VLLRRIQYPETAGDWMLSTALLPLSWLYCAGWGAYASVYLLGLKRRRKFAVPILGIGNLEVGGTGKTPVTIAVAKLLSEGRKIAVSASAHGSPSSHDARLVRADDAMNAREHGDEPCLLRKQLPGVDLILGRNRVLAAQIAEGEEYDLLILDDGFQHLPLARTLDTVLWNGDTKNRRLLPAGPFREPASGIRRASGAFSESGDAPEKKTFGFSREYVGLRPICGKEIVPVSFLNGKSVNAACAIARPQAFLGALRDFGAVISRTELLPDHSEFDAVNWSNDAPWIVTAKDAVKLGGNEAVIYVLEMRVQFCDEEEVRRWLETKLFH